MKWSAREDKRNWLEERAAAEEKAAENVRNKELYTITNSIAGERRRREEGVKECSRQNHKKDCRVGFFQILEEDKATNG